MTARRWALAGLVVWAIATTLLAAQLMVAHSVAIAPPARTARLRAGLVAALPPAPRRIAHLIPTQCSCTLRILEHLAARGPRPGWTETIVLAGGGLAVPPALAAAGFTVRLVPAPWLAEALALDGAPVMAALVGDEVRWAGGYFDSAAADRPLDAEVLAELDVGGAPAALPIFGCPVAPALARRLDPLGVLGWR
jgi:hypothetical protein